MRKVLSPLFTLSVSFYCTTSLFAQEKNPAPAMDTVVVTAQKRVELLQKAPLAITHLSGNQVNAYRLWQIKEITAIAPNLYSSDPGDGRDVISIRGITTTSYDPAVAVYIDGVNQFSLDTYIPNLYDVERIEVLRGPQGSLYGRNAMGGVINIITKQPSSQTQGSVFLSAGNFNQRRINLNARVPIIKGKLFLGTGILQESRNGFYTNEFTGKDYDRQKMNAGNFYLKYKLNDQWNALINVKSRIAENNGAFPLIYSMAGPADDLFKLNQNATTTMKDRSLNASLSLSYSSASFQFSSQTAFQRNYRFYSTPIDGDFTPLDAITVINNYGKDFNNIKVWTQDIRFSSGVSNSGPWKWVAGLYLFSQKAPNKQATRFGADANLLGVGDSLFTLLNSTWVDKKGLALYAQAGYALTKKLNLTVGLRTDHEKLNQTVLGEYQRDPNPAFVVVQPELKGSTDFNAVSPKIGVDFNFSSSQMAYASYSRGFRTGGLSPLSSDPSQPPMNPFKPEYSNNYELGIKNSFWANKLRLNLAIFYTRLRDAQIPSLILPDAVTITKNVGKLNSSGMELEVLANPLKGLMVQYNFGYTKAVFEETKFSRNGTVIDLKGKRQLFTPDMTSLLAVQYDVDLSKKWKGFVRGEWKYIGATYYDLANIIRQSPYNLLNASMGIEFGSFGLKAWVRNLADNRYISYAYDFGALHLGDPRNFGITFSSRF